MTSPPGRTRRPRGRRATTLVVGLVALISPLLAAISPASAYWSATGSGSSTAATGTLAGPVDVTVPETSIPDVPVSWTAGVNDDPVDGYYVTRYQFSVNTEPVFVPACSSSPTQLITLTSCTDTGLPDGNYTYRVTAVFRTWTATSQSSPVDVVGPALLAFTSDVADTEPGSTILPPLTVALQTESGSPYPWAGVQVSVAFDANPSEGTLAGQTAVTTDDEGVATFDTLSINLPGNGYSLVAYSLLLAPASSNSFDVNPPSLLGTARSYSVLAANSVSNNGATTVNGDLGVSSGELVGFGPGTVDGEVHLGDADAIQALDEVLTTYDLLSAMEPTAPLESQSGGVTLDPGVYRTGAGGLSLSGTLTLDAHDDPAALFIFQSDGPLTTSGDSAVALINGARAANVYWVVNGGTADLGTTSSLTGTILASGAITLGFATELIGRAFSLDTVNLDHNTIRFASVRPAITIDGGANAITTDETATITGASSAIPYSRVTVTIGNQTVVTQTLVTTVRADGTWRVTTDWLGAWDWRVVAKVRETNGNTASTSQILTMEVNPGPVDLGPADTFSIVARNSVVNSGETAVSGDVAVAVGTDITGFGPEMVDGATHAGDDIADAAFLGAFDAYMALSQRPASREIGGDIGGLTFHTGVFQSLTSVLTVSGTVTLDAQDDPDATFIFNTPSLETGAGSEVVLANGAQASNVFWIVGSASTGENSALVGNILASGAITLRSHTTLSGLAFATGVVSIDAATLTGVSPAPAARVAVLPDPSETPVPGQTPVPTPSTTGTPAPEPSVDQPSATESPTASPTPSATATAEPSPTPTPTPTPTLEDPSPTARPTATKDPPPTPSASATDQGGTP